MRNDPARDAPGPFPLALTVEVKGPACELPATLVVPLSRLSVAEARWQVEQRGLVARISDSTIWRWLHEHAIRPWQLGGWIFPRDPEFQAKAGRILDLYARCWHGEPLRRNELVLSADEKTSIQARRQIHPRLPSGPDQPMRVEHEYRRGGAWAYLAALDVHRARVFGRCEPTTGIAPFERLVTQAMSQWPYNQARRVFWIMDNGSSHRGEASVQPLTRAHPRLVPVHGPIHASWLNQVEIYFSIVQRKALTPTDFPDLAAVAQRLAEFERHYESITHPFEWKFTRADLNALLARMRSRYAQTQPPEPAA